MADTVNKTITVTRLDATIRISLLNHLREINQLLVQLKGFAADKDIIDRYGGQELQDLDLDPDTPTDVTAIMKDIEDIHKQIALYRGKVRGKETCNFRDSGISMASDRNSYLNTEEMAFADAVQNDELPDLPAFLSHQAEAARNSRPEPGTRSRVSVKETTMAEEETTKKTII